MRRKEVIDNIKSDLGVCHDTVYTNEWGELAFGWDHPAEAHHELGDSVNHLLCESFLQEDVNNALENATSVMSEDIEGGTHRDDVGIALFQSFPDEAKEALVAFTFHTYKKGWYHYNTDLVDEGPDEEPDSDLVQIKEIIKWIRDGDYSRAAGGIRSCRWYSLNSMTTTAGNRIAVLLEGLDGG